MAIRAAPQTVAQEILSRIIPRPGQVANGFLRRRGRMYRGQ
jgi:hypothetical protein